MGRLTKLLEKLGWRKLLPVRFNDPARYYRLGGGWGDAIEMHKDDAPSGQSSRTRRVHGWKYRRPTVGDVLISAMSSGRDAAYLFVSVEYCRDPDDMFFADVEFKGYVDELDMPERLKEKGGYLL